MKVVVVGGKLQGVEAAYLARKAGWEVTLVDKNDNPPATGLSSEFHRLDVVTDRDRFKQIIKNHDLIIPAFEDEFVVKELIKTADMVDVPVAYDVEAYSISSSKIKSDKLFAENNIPAPKYWPDCRLPLIAKPSLLSGSHGVTKIKTEEQLENFIAKHPKYREDWVIQEYIQGPSYSLEVMGYNGTYITLQATEIHVDESYDCKRVVAPTDLNYKLDKKFHEISAQIAKLINLKGIMDVEIINHNGDLKVLEIDARLPSQTPTAVYKSTGINMLLQLADIYVYKQVPKTLNNNQVQKHVIYEHVQALGTTLKTLGESIMGTAGTLKYYEDFFGADEAITNFQSSNKPFVATLILTADNDVDLWNKRKYVLDNILKHCNLTTYIDSMPPSF